MTVHVKFLQVCTLISSFCWKYIKFQLNKYRWAISHDTKEWCNIWRKTDLLFQKMTRISWILTQALQSLRNLHFDWFLLCKLYNVWPKKVHDILHELSYMTLKSDAHFEEKMPCDWKLAWVTSHIFTRALESVKIGALIGSFCPK